MSWAELWYLPPVKLANYVHLRSATLLCLVATSMACFDVNRSLMLSDAPGPPEGNAPTSGAIADFEVFVVDRQGEASSIRPGQGKPLLINFWASWCKPCAYELQELPELRRNLRVQGFDVEFALIAVDDSGRGPFRMAEDLGVELPVYLATIPEHSPGSNQQGPAESMIRVPAIPFTCLYSSEGRELGCYTGARRWADPEWTGYFMRLLEAA